MNVAKGMVVAGVKILLNDEFAARAWSDFDQDEKLG
jgi:hypothetical protein